MAQSPFQLLVRKLATHASLGDEDRQAILNLPHTRKTLESNTYLVREGDLPTMCAMLLSGFAYRQKTTGEGSRQIVALHIAGDAMDFQNLFLDVSDHSLQMLTRGDVAMVAREHLHELARARPAVGHAIFVSTLVEASIFREWILNVGRRDAPARLAHFLCEVAVRLEGQDLVSEYGYELPMTQEQLADAVGLTSVHVNRTLKLLEAKGLIERDRRRIMFPDWRRMRDFGDFNQRYLHMEPQLSAAV